MMWHSTTASSISSAKCPSGKIASLGFLEPNLVKTITVFFAQTHGKIAVIFGNKTTVEIWEIPFYKTWKTPVAFFLEWIPLVSVM